MNEQSQRNQQRDIEINIDRLLLDGFAGLDARHFERDLKGELARLIAERGLPGGGHRDFYQPYVNAGTLAHARTRPGVQVARSVYSQLRGGGFR